MSKLVLDFQIPEKYNAGQFSDIVRALCQQVNTLSEGQMVARYYSSTIAPNVTAIGAAIGDIRWDASVSEQGSASSKYVRLGWVCTASGSPGTWKEMRVLTGN